MFSFIVPGKPKRKRVVQPKGEPSAKYRAHLKRLREEEAEREAQEKKAKAEAQNEAKTGEEDKRQPKEIIITAIRIIKRF